MAGILQAPDLGAAIAAELQAARARTRDLLSPLPDEELVRQHSPLMSPLVWDLAHIAYFEELWLVRRIGGLGPVRAGTDELYDAFEHERSARARLPLLDPADARAYADEVRKLALDVLAGAELDSADPLLREGFVYGLVLQHELQHQETMLQTIQLSGLPHLGGGPQPCGGSGSVVVEAGRFSIGTDDDAWAYDNERPEHEVELSTFAIDAARVLNAEYLEFVEATGAEPPQFWDRESDGSWSLLRFGRQLSLPLDEPVQHVSWHEADTFARWAGKRLPTETEWETAASLGFLDSVGQVWEWTASDFLAYPGFRAFPYREYSEVFFGPDSKVLRGGSWATHPLVARTTFRNWDFPIRRQIFAGFRCAAAA
jgi:gamma-glutamyl hercynylcysteine S-oxide synthase